MTEYAQNGELAIEDNPENTDGVPIRLACRQSMMNFPLQGVSELEDLRDVCNEALDALEDE